MSTLRPQLQPNLLVAHHQQAMQHQQQHQQLLHQHQPPFKQLSNARSIASNDVENHRPNLSAARSFLSMSNGKSTFDPANKENATATTMTAGTLNSARNTRSRTGASNQTSTNIINGTTNSSSALPTSSTTLNQKPRRVLQEIKPEPLHPSSTSAGVGSSGSLTSRRAGATISGTSSLLAAGLQTSTNNSFNHSNTTSSIPSLTILNTQRGASQSLANGANFPRSLSMTTSSLLTSTAQSVVSSYRPTAHVPIGSVTSHYLSSRDEVYESSSVSVTTSTTIAAPIESYEPDHFTASMLSTFCAQSEVSQLTAVQEKEREILKEREAAASSTQSLAHVPTIHMSDAPAANDATDVEGAFKRDGETVPSECIPSVIPVHSDEGVTLETVDVQVIDTATAMDLCSMPASPIDHTSQPLLLETLSSEPSLVQNAPSESPFGSVPSSLPSTDVHLYSTELTADILQYWFATEGRFQPQADYLQHQPDLNSKMREILIDWLHEVVSRFRLQTETMFLAVGLLDRFLACKAVGRKKLQLVGCVALLLASKYEEIYTPEINDFLIISDHAYERDHILHMESIMLNSLNFHLTQVTSLRFMQRFMNTPEIDYILQYTRGNGHPMLMCQYLLEMTLQFVKFLEYLPSTVAASCLYIVANHLHINSGASTPFDWSSSLQRETRHTVDAMRPCIQDVYIHWRTLTETAAAALAQGTLASGGPGNKCLAIFRKYGKEAYGQVNQTTFHKPACIN